MTDTAPASGDPAADRQVDAVRTGYAFSGPALELGALLVERAAAGRRPGAGAAGHAQPARPGRRRHGNGQDQDPAADGRAAVRPRRARLPRRRQGRPVRHLAAGAAERQAHAADPEHRADLAGDGVPGGVPGAGRSGRRGAGAGHHDQLRPDAAREGARPQRDADPSLSLVFHYADQAGLALLDLKDLRAVIQYLVSRRGQGRSRRARRPQPGDRRRLLRELVEFADSGAEQFFGEPEFETERPAADGAGRPGDHHAASS